jgi:DNA invertase Pin-like site-specific DNA recombinase
MEGHTMTSTDTTNQERSGRWLRVSTKKQDEASQVPDVAAWEVGHAYTVASTYTVHGASAFKGNKRFDAEWSRVLEDFRSKKITVLVVWKQDRIDRKLNTFKMLAEVAALGGRVEFVTQPHLNDLTTMGGRIALKVQEEIAYAESQDKSDRIKAKHATIHAANGLVGRPPFGLISVARGDGFKTMEATEIGRTIVPAIFQRVSNGHSLMKVAAWLDTQGIKPTSEVDRNGNPVTSWSPQSVRGIIRNTVYRGQQKAMNGSKRSGGLTLMEGFESLVSATVWKSANERLSNAPRGRRGTTKHAPALLTGSLVCGNCQAPVYRVFGGNGASRRAYYRCAGHLPQRQGCGMAVRLEDLDSIVNEALSERHLPIIESQFIAGDAQAIEERITAIGFELADLPSRGLDEEKEDTERASLRNERKSLSEALKTAQPSRWAPVVVRDDAGEVITYAARWTAADFDGKRAMLKSLRVIVKRDEDNSPRVGITDISMDLAA